MYAKEVLGPFAWVVSCSTQYCQLGLTEVGSPDNASGDPHELRAFECSRNRHYPSVGVNLSRSLKGSGRRTMRLPDLN